MVGITGNPGFLQQCKKHGCDVLVLPMIFMEGITHDPSFIDNQLGLLFNAPGGFSFKPLIVQVIGTNQDQARIAMDHLASYDLDGINLNLGCPSSKLSKSSAGAYMLDAPEKRDGMITTLERYSPFPFSIKIRLLGARNPDVGRSKAFCKTLEGLGIDWMSIHGRTRKQGYSGVARWDIIKEIHDFISIPLIGNGDVKHALQGNELVKSSHADAFMIGRAAIADPKVFDATGSAPASLEVDLALKLELYNDLFGFLEKYSDTRVDHFLSLHERKRWLLYFSRGARNARIFRARVSSIRDLESLEDLVTAIMTRDDNDNENTSPSC